MTGPADRVVKDSKSESESRVRGPACPGTVTVPVAGPGSESACIDSLGPAAGIAGFNFKSLSLTVTSGLSTNVTVTVVTVVVPNLSDSARPGWSRRPPAPAGYYNLTPSLRLNPGNAVLTESLRPQFPTAAGPGDGPQLSHWPRRASRGPGPGTAARRVDHDDSS
jgi:hypothetical protein